MLSLFTTSFLLLSLHSTPAIEDYIIFRAMAYQLPIKTLLAIAQCESGTKHFNKDGTVLKGVVNNKDIGTFQINERFHLAEATKLNLDIHNAHKNIEYAMILFKQSGDKPWVHSKPCWSKKLANES